VDRAYRGCPLPTAPATRLAEPTPTPTGGDDHLITGHWTLAPVCHTRRLARLASLAQTTFADPAGNEFDLVIWQQQPE
jgi:hypothetical protein